MNKTAYAFLQGFFISLPVLALSSLTGHADYGDVLASVIVAAGFGILSALVTALKIRFRR